MKSSTKTMLALHILLAVYSVGNVFSKLAADVPFLSPRFILYYGIVLLILGIYAIGWQQVIKRMPLTTAYANKAVTIVWGIVFGMILFGETVTPLMIAGAFLIVAGIVLYAIEEGRVQAATLQDLNAALGVPEVHRGRGATEDTPGDGGQQ